MPELPDITTYIDAIEKLRGARLRELRLKSIFVLRSVEPGPSELAGRTLQGSRRIGKRVVLEFTDDFFAVMHLMVAGRLRWRDDPEKGVPNEVARWVFDRGAIVFTEAGKKKRASLHLVRGAEQLREFNRGGIEIADSTDSELAAALARENRTLKRALTDPRILSGIGNAWSDEILFDAGLSPTRRTQSMPEDELLRLAASIRSVVARGTAMLRNELQGAFPEKVTAFHSGMKVHGRYRKPCVRCDTPVQRIRYASNEANYCPRCQTGGKLLADRSLSRLLKGDWPRTIDELERRQGS